MNVSCTACSAKYAIPDEKLRGKKVKITCKHCGTGIIVDGTKLEASDAAAGAPQMTGPVAVAAPAAAAAPPIAAPVAVAAPAAAAAPQMTAPVASATAAAAAAPQMTAPVASATPAAASEPMFDIAYPDDRQETLPVSAVVERYERGALDDAAFLWREGMIDWKAPLDVPEVASALAARGVRKKPAATTASTPLIGDDEATKVEASPFEGLDLDGGDSRGWREPAQGVPSSTEAAFTLTERQAPPVAAAAPAPAIAASQPKTPEPAVARPAPAATGTGTKPAAARRASDARGGGDLFGDLAAAGSEEDESLGIDAKDPARKMTGARNESSVLFSLDALVKQEQKPAAKKPQAKQDDAAAILLGTDSGPSSIANVGGGSFASAFAAPDFTAPVVAPPPESRSADSLAYSSSAAPKKGKGMWITLGAIALLGGSAVALDVPGRLSGTAAAPSPPAKPEPLAAAPPGLPDAAQAPAATEGAAAPSATATDSAPPASQAAPAAAGGAAAAPTGMGATSTKPSEADRPPAEKPAGQPAEKPADQPAEASAPPFDKAAAVAALTAAAGSAQSCKAPDGPTGSGKVSITFMPSGRATNTQVSGDLAGTAVGGCVARIFRGAKIPAFSGDAVTVSKSFSVQ